MALPSSYLTSYKNLPAILDSIKAAQAPDRFTIKFLQDLGYTSAADRLVIKMLKTIGFLGESGEPTERYHEFLDPNESGRVIADGIREAYSDLFQINRDAQNMSVADIKGKLKTISKGAFSDAVIAKMANTFVAFAEHADFDKPGTEKSAGGTDAPNPGKTNEGSAPQEEKPKQSQSTKSPRLVYEVNIHLPTTRDPAVYDALFSSLSKHLDI